jgi:TolB-like protein/Tfp pilus assembly protein PilF
MTDQPRPAGAVFLSYAREDSAPARRIAEALRGFGVEVWFDVSELRGGDVWDQKIRRQIKECTLFIPVISSQTQEREEGYFRREWRLAVDRTHDMAESRTFIVPVIVDDTREADANVPEQFLKAHFTRLPGGEPTPHFVEQVKRLLNPGRAGETATRPAGRSAAPASASTAKKSFPVVTVVLAVAVLALIAFVFLRPSAKPEPIPVVATPPAAAPKPAEPAPAAGPDAKSIAVMPFVDMSQAKDQEYFSDGLSEELLNLLAKVPALQVTSRSSAFSYKGKEVKLSQVAKELNVAHILEGSVRKSGNRLRITAQLIDARTDKHLWSETYDRSLDDIFAVQDEIAAAVVAQLKVSLLGDAPKAKTADPKAYALWLQARELNRQGSAEGLTGSIALCEQALAIDPSLVSAWCTLAACYTAQSDLGQRPNDEGYRLAREALEKALAIDPDSAAAHARMSSVLQTANEGLALAAQHYQRAVAAEPTNTDILTDGMRLARTLGRFEDAIAIGEYVVAHDPLNAYAHMALGASYTRAGRYEEGIAALRTSLRLSPGRGLAHYGLAVNLQLKGDLPAALKEAMLEPNETWRLDALAILYHAAGKKAESDAALAELIKKYQRESSWNIAYIYATRGEADKCFEWLDQAIVYRDPGVSLTAWHWAFANVRNDPRWLPFLKKIGRSPEQLAAIKLDMKPPAR